MLFYPQKLDFGFFLLYLCGAFSEITNRRKTHREFENFINVKSSKIERRISFERRGFVCLSGGNARGRGVPERQLQFPSQRAER